MSKVETLSAEDISSRRITEFTKKQLVMKPSVFVHSPVSSLNCVRIIIFS